MLPGTHSNIKYVLKQDWDNKRKVKAFMKQKSYNAVGFWRILYLLKMAISSWNCIDSDCKLSSVNQTHLCIFLSLALYRRLVSVILWALCVKLKIRSEALRVML